jgi:hypothetical protein
MKNSEQINVENLLIKIEKFYKLFYFNKLVKGILLAFGVILSFFLVFDVLFYYLSLINSVRFILFYVLIFIFLSTVYFWILDPIFRLFKLTKGISNENVAEYIGNHYPEIGDQLINTLQFYKTENKSHLALAAIEQKSQFLKPFDFNEAVPAINSNKKIFLFLVPLSFFIGILGFNTQLLTEGTNRLINYEVDYSIIAPFDFKISPQDVSVNMGDDILISGELVGNEIPSSVYIVLNGVKYRAKKVNDQFEFLVQNITLNSNYHIEAGKFSSTAFSITVLPNPKVSNLTVVLEHPSYMKVENTVLVNPSLIEVYSGVKVKWNFNVQETDNVDFLINDSSVSMGTFMDDEFSFDKRVFENLEFSLLLSNAKNDLINGFNGEIIVTDDAYPLINVQSDKDSNNGVMHFMGSVQDDFGFKSLIANFSDGDTIWTESIPINVNQLQNIFNYQVNADKFTKTTQLVFEVRDNDYLNGFKLSKSSIINFEVLSIDELDSSLMQEGDDLIKKMAQLSSDSKELKEELSITRKELLNKKSLNWSEKQRLNNLLDSHKELQKDVDSTKDRLKEHQDKISTDNEINEDVLKKQKQLNELFDKVMDEETKKLYEELQALLKELNKDKIQEHLKKMELNNEDINKELDRNLEIFKQMEIEQGLEKSMKKLDEISKKQLDLSSENENKEITNKENIEKQKELNKEFDKLKEEMKRLDSLNKELKEPNEFNFEKEKLDEISKDQDGSIDESEDGKQEESSEKQKDAGKKMKDLKEKLEESLAMESSGQEGEDLESLRKILENLLVLSFTQEDVMHSISGLDKSDPGIVKLNQDQKQLLDDSEMVKDSLYALSSRVVQLQSVIMKETKAVTSNMNNSVENLTERNLQQAQLYQQKSLTSLNNLAVLLDEIIQSMQEQKKKKNKGTGSCSKPGEGKPKPSLKSSKKKQEELAKKMNELKKKMEKGSNPGKMNPGKVGKGMSKEIAQMAAQQEMIRQEIRKMADQLQKEGNMDGSGELKKLEELLERNETDLVNLKLDQDFYERQQDIKIKMLEAENADRKREKEKKREAELAIDYKKNNIGTVDDYLKQKEFELELLRMFNPELSGYYKTRVQEYNLENK